MYVIERGGGFEIVLKDFDCFTIEFDSLGTKRSDMETSLFKQLFNNIINIIIIRMIMK
jgi:hypothetical protein